MTALENLYKLSKRYRMYASEKMKENTLDDIRLVAEQNGYSVSNWQQTGEWKRFEAVLNSIQKPFETVLKPETETTKTANKRFMGGFETETATVETVEIPETVETVSMIETLTPETETGTCEACNGKLTGRAKRFCSPRCKNEFHNKKRNGDRLYS